MDMILDELKSSVTIFTNAPGHFDRNTGQFVEGTETSKNIKAAVLPLSQNDMMRNIDGGYTADDRKIYTSEILKNGQKVLWEGNFFKIDSEINYVTIDNYFRRYFIKRVGGVSD